MEEQIINNLQDTGMYNETLKAENKIFTAEDLIEIITAINNELIELSNKYNEEKVQNEGKNLNEQNWTLKYYTSSLRANFNLYDATTINVDNYEDMLNFINNRLSEIKDISFWAHCSYSIKTPGSEALHVPKKISMYVYENKIDFELELGTKDRNFYSVYDLIKQKILNAPERFDRVVKNKSMIKNKIEFAIGLIPSLFICFLLVLIPLIRGIYSASYILFPVLTLLLGYFLGNIIYDGKMESLYSTISPNKKYAGHDSNYKSIYKNDINDYIKRSEVIIGKNVNNIKKRNEISKLETKYSKYIPIELIILLVLSILVVILGKLV